MRRGTTPLIRLATEQNWTGFDKVWVTFEQKGYYELTIKDDRVELSEGGTDVYVQLTQEETLAFKKGSASVQIKGLQGTNVEATDEVKIKVLDILCEEVM